VDVAVDTVVAVGVGVEVAEVDSSVGLASSVGGRGVCVNNAAISVSFATTVSWDAVD
jgi:hypothetical protein